MFATLLRAIFPVVERVFRFLRTDARQEYLLGMQNEVPLETLVAHLRAQGFENQLFAWVDDGQVVSLRKKDGAFQYHLRIFNDGEVRGHYEYTPEDAPLKHLRRVDREARTGEFLHFVAGYIERTPRRVQNYATLSTDTQVYSRAS